jgi:hypothetical protein
MSGTDTTRDSVTGGPVIILVDPQLGQNIGMVARAMLNCGLEELRLVRPRDAWPNPAAESAAAGAQGLLGDVGSGHGAPGIQDAAPGTSAPSCMSFQVMPSCSALNEASMMLVETPTVVQRRPPVSALSIMTRVMAAVPLWGVRMRTL